MRWAGLSRPVVGTVITKTVQLVNEKLTCDNRVTRDFVEKLATPTLVELVHPLATKHANAVVAARTGVWVAALNGKLLTQ